MAKNKEFFYNLKSEIIKNSRKKEKDEFSWEDLKYPASREISYNLFQIWRLYEFQAAAVTKQGAWIEEDFQLADYVNSPVDNLIIIIFIKKYLINSVKYMSAATLNTLLIEEKCGYNNYRRLDEKLRKLVYNDFLVKVHFKDLTQKELEQNNISNTTNYLYTVVGSRHVQPILDNKNPSQLAAFNAAPLHKYLMAIIEIINQMPHDKRVKLKKLINT